MLDFLNRHKVKITIRKLLFWRLQAAASGPKPGFHHINIEFQDPGSSAAVHTHKDSLYLLNPDRRESCPKPTLGRKKKGPI